jgi:hypothetical protein
VAFVLLLLLLLLLPPPPPPPLTITYPQPVNEVLPNGINRSIDMQQKKGRIQKRNNNTEAH